MIYGGFMEVVTEQRAIETANALITSALHTLSNIPKGESSRLTSIAKTDIEKGYIILQYRLEELKGEKICL